MTSCIIPPIGWTCSRDMGHDGPCAASPSADYEKGVKDALSSLTLEEANTCGFPSPYTEVTQFRDRQSPLAKLMSLRKKRLTGA